MRGKNLKHMMSRKFFILCFCILILGDRVPGFSQPREYLLKAVFLEKFTRFVEWPVYSNIQDTSQSFVIGILGENPFDVNLSALFENQRIKNKPVEIRYLNSIDSLDTCHLIFISKSEKDNLKNIIKAIGKKPILTVSDSDHFSGQGVIINLFVNNNKIRFEIDEKAIQRAGFRVSYLLLKEAKIVNPN